MNLEWNLKQFNELTNSELHEIFKLRVDVFIVEQNCVYPEIDGKDEKAHHLFASSDGSIIAYARILAPGISYQEASIGRVIVAPSARKNGIGHLLINEAVKTSLKLYSSDIKIGAQAHLEEYYMNAGFVRVSDEYDEDGIMHIDMLRPR